MVRKQFKIAELKFLVDAIQSMKFITEKKPGEQKVECEDVILMCSFCCLYYPSFLVELVFLKK